MPSAVCMRLLQGKWCSNQSPHKQDPVARPLHLKNKQLKPTRSINCAACFSTTSAACRANVRERSQKARRSNYPKSNYEGCSCSRTIRVCSSLDSLTAIAPIAPWPMTGCHFEWSMRAECLFNESLIILRRYGFCCPERSLVKWKVMLELFTSWDA